VKGLVLGEGKLLDSGKILGSILHFNSIQVYLCNDSTARRLITETEKIT